MTQVITDSEILFRLKNGDEKALRLIFDKYWDKLLAYAINRLKDEDEAKETVQDLFIKIWSIRESLDVQISLNAYLSAAIRNRVYDRLDKMYRALARSRSLIQNTIEPISAAADDRIFQRELFAQVEKSVNTLPEKCRIVFIKSRFEGLSNREIAEELDLSQRTVETHISNALKVLRKNLPGNAFNIISLGSGVVEFYIKHR